MLSRIGSTDLSILRGYELWLDDGLGGTFVMAYNGSDPSLLVLPQRPQRESAGVREV